MRLETGVGDWRQEKESGDEMRQETGAHKRHAIMTVVAL